MGAGDKIAKAALKVVTKVPGADKAVSLAVDRLSDFNPAEDACPFKIRSVLAEFGQACEIRNLSLQKAMALTGDYQAGDMEVRIPGAAISESDLRTDGALILYGRQELDIVRVDPDDIAFGVVIWWRVVARVRSRTDG